MPGRRAGLEFSVPPAQVRIGPEHVAEGQHAGPAWLVRSQEVQVGDAPAPLGIRYDEEAVSLPTPLARLLSAGFLVMAAWWTVDLLHDRDGRSGWAQWP